jgi:sterol desaturase/sphingolipid hydroxylase (fatty acid hydroxylase superfamily)
VNWIAFLELAMENLLRGLASAPTFLNNAPTFAITWLTFFSAGVVTFAIQVYRFRRAMSFKELAHHIFPFDSWVSKSVQMDVKIYVARTLIDKLFVALPLICTVAVSSYLGSMLSRLFPGHTVAQPTYLFMIGCSIVIFLVAEFSDFLTHYIAHTTPMLWELHKVHHSALFLNPLTSKRGHPLEFIFVRATSGILCGIPVGIFTFMFGFGMMDMLFISGCAGKLGTVATLDALRHSHFPISLGWFDRIFISPHMHQVHHSSLTHHWDKNFGTNLSIFDWIFGTAYRPKKEEEIRYGLGNVEEHDYDRLFGALVGPVTKMWKLMTQRPSSETRVSSPDVI